MEMNSSTVMSCLFLFLEFIDRELYFLIQSVKTDDWIHLMRVLNVTESEREACQTLYTNKLEQQYQMLQIWLRKPEDGHRTHRDELVEALALIRYEQVAQMFLKGSTRSGKHIVSLQFIYILFYYTMTIL